MPHNFSVKIAGFFLKSFLKLFKLKWTYFALYFHLNYFFIHVFVSPVKFNFPKKPHNIVAKISKCTN